MAPVRPDVSGLPVELADRVIAAYDLDVITLAIDPTFKADWADWQQRKWFPFHIKDKSGFRFGGAYYTYSATDSGLGSRPLPSDEAAEYLGTKFIRLFEILAGA